MDIDEIEVTDSSVSVDIGEISPFDDEDYYS